MSEFPYCLSLGNYQPIPTCRHIRTDLLLDERLGDNALIDDVQEIVTPMNCG